MDYKEKYENALEKMKGMRTSWETLSYNGKTFLQDLESIFPELKDSDEKIRKDIIAFIKENYSSAKPWIAWLEKQGSEPNWCHHKVDLSNCSEEYRKAYYDGWNNCNMQHSQCNAERNDVVKCLINGMKFYYEDNKEAMWGTEKFSMKVKDILNWLEKQGEPVEINPTEFDTRLQVLIGKFGSLPKEELIGSLSFWMNVVQNDGTYKPAEKQIEPKFIAEP